MDRITEHHSQLRQLCDLNVDHPQACELSALKQAAFTFVKDVY